MAATGFQLCSDIPIGDGAAPVYILGPCVIESEDAVLAVARTVQDLGRRHKIPVIFKASFDKANRSSVSSFRGPGLTAGLAALARVKSETGMPILTDVHLPEQAAVIAEVADALQIPAFLCRQTDLLVACAETGLPVNIKKGQFMAPEDMSNAVEKVRSSGNQKVCLTERGSTFGYHNLVVDMRSLAVMGRLAPVIFDVTHSLQLPGGLGHATGGARDFHPHLARAAAAVGVDGFFIEVHPDPPRALSDATTQLSPAEVDVLIPQLEAVTRAVRDSAP